MHHNELLLCLKAEASKIDKAMHEDLAAIDSPLLAEIIAHTLFGSGKKVRPALVVMSARICGCSQDSIYRLAGAFEYLHVATLLHDDVIDHADQRRGRTAANRIWGNSPAILSGDYLHARSMFLVGTLGGKRCLEIICRATAAMVKGEFLQMRNAADLNQSENDYFAVIKNKTAGLIAAACETGAVFACDIEKYQKALQVYGNNLGMAFQVIDDLLDYQGDPHKTGKAVGNDFCEGKMTLPLIHALSCASAIDRDFILAILAGKKETRGNHFQAVRSLVEHYGGFDYAGQKAVLLIDKALAALEVFEDNQAASEKKALTGLAHYVLARDK